LLLEQRHQKVPRGETTTERELRFSILSLSLFSKKKIKKEKIERKRESASLSSSLFGESALPFERSSRPAVVKMVVVS